MAAKAISAKKICLKFDAPLKVSLVCTMALYKVKASWWLKKLYGNLIWDMPDEKAVYLTFDDGPHPTATPFVLEQLQQYDAKATFFCIGNNVASHPEIYSQVKDWGHTVGNHTYDHMNGWHATTDQYIQNITRADELIDSKLFRPPYGRIKRAQANMLTEAGRKIYMWDVLSGDFDVALSPEKCLENVLQYIEPGSIIVFHDSTKAWDRMSYALPRVLQYCKEKNWQMKALPKD
jgi:peptidoglycan/xylan/chitin deacetylase (PgdA/CDA1 family)